jgi:hypothetical protein
MNGQIPVQSLAERFRRGAPAVDRVPPRGAWFFFVTQLLAVVLLQRIVVPGPAIEVILFIFAAGLAGLCLFGEVYISRTRVVLFAAFAASVCLSSFLAGLEVSTLSILLLLAGYSTYVIRLNVTREFYLRCVNFFVGVMVVIAFITLVQIGGQAATGKVVVPSMDEILPKNMIITGFVYWQPLYWGSEIIKPPAFFFREVSFVSQFLALAIVAEIVFFRRIWRLLILIVALFSTFAGTGLLILAIMSPLLLTKLSRAGKLLTIPLAAAAVVVLFFSGWFSNPAVEHRADEYENTSSSAYGRFIYPALVLSRLAEFDNPLFTGMGGGNADRAIYHKGYAGVDAGAGVLTAPTKMLLEYGIVPAILFYIFLFYCLFHRAPDTSFSVAQLLLHVFGGGYLLVSPFIILFFILGVMFKIPEQQADYAPARRMVGEYPVGS